MNGQIPSIYYIAGNPNNLLEWNAGSDIAIDAGNGNYYIADGDTSGSTWIRLGSTT